MNASTSDDANGASNQGDQRNGTNVDPAALLASYQAFLSTASDAQATAMRAMLHQLPGPNHPLPFAPNVTTSKNPPRAD